MEEKDIFSYFGQKLTLLHLWLWVDIGNEKSRAITGGNFCLSWSLVPNSALSNMNLIPPMMVVNISSQRRLTNTFLIVKN